MPRQVIFAGLLVAFVVTDARAQVLSGGLSPLENVGAAGARSPGLMVGAGLARREQVLSGPFRDFAPITATGTPGFFEGFRSTASVVLATQLTVAIDLLVNALINRSGLLAMSGSTTPVAGPTPTPTPGDNGGGRTPGRGKAQR